jgi:anti-sigma-K factor RskA
MSSDDGEEVDIRYDLPAYLNGELDAVGEARVRAALNRDPRLRQELRALSEAIEALESATAGAERPEASNAGHRRSRARLFALSAAAAVIVALVVLVAVVQFSRQDELARQLITLEPVGQGTSSGTAEVYRDRGGTFVDLRFESLPDRGEASHYEAWLLSPGDSPPISLGVISHSGGTLTIPPGVPSSYTMIDVSVEHLDGNPGHSGISVLRSKPLAPPSPRRAQLRLVRCARNCPAAAA